MIDTMAYCVILPPGNYTANVPIEVPVARGPSVVRDGYGTAVLKRIFSTYVCASGNSIRARVTVSNSSWNDEMSNTLSNAVATAAYTTLSNNGPAIQNGADCEVTPNSSFTVKVVPISNFTTTVNVRVLVLIDIDYPQIAAVANPREEKGTPMTIVRSDNVTYTPVDVAAIDWNVYNVDIFKAGYRYLMTEAGFTQTAASTVPLGMLAISGTANQAGLVQIIPVIAAPPGCLRYSLDYSTVMVKGPMNIEYALLSSVTASEVTTSAAPVSLELDFIKRQ